MSELNMEKLEAIFWGDQREQPTRVRLARVVTALRDEMQTMCDEKGRKDCCGVGVQSGYDPPECCAQPLFTVSAYDVDGVFNEILAPRGDEAAGKGANTVDAQQCQTNTTKPAAAPDDADVCKWKDVGNGWDTGCGGWDTAWASVGGKIVCPICKAPIKFVEAAR